MIFVVIHFFLERKKQKLPRRQVFFSRETVGPCRLPTRAWRKPQISISVVVVNTTARILGFMKLPSLFFLRIKLFNQCKCMVNMQDVFKTNGVLFGLVIKPIGSMYGIFGHIYHKNQPNVGKYTIHGSYGK